MATVRPLRHILRYLLSFQLTSFFYAYNHSRSGFRQATIAADDSTTLRRRLRGHDSRFLVCRSLQCVSRAHSLGFKCLCSPFVAEHYILPDLLRLARVAFLRLQSSLQMLTRYIISIVSGCASRIRMRTNHPQSQARYACLIIATSGAFSCIPPLLGWLSANLHSSAHVGIAIALNISWGTPGQITGVWIYKSSEKRQGYPTGHWVNAGLLFFVAVACVGLRAYYQMLNKRTLHRDAIGKIFRY
jgi:hypothetical protein